MDALNTAAHPGPLDPTASCAPDEPIFPLVAHDPDAPAAIRHWSDTRRARIASAIVQGDVEPDALNALKSDLARCTEADELADAFDAWRERRDTSDAPLERATYNGPTKDDSARAAHHAGVQAIAEAAFHLAAALQAFEAVGDPDMVELCQLHERTKALHMSRIETRATYTKDTG